MPDVCHFGRFSYYTRRSSIYPIKRGIGSPAPKLRGRTVLGLDALARRELGRSCACSSCRFAERNRSQLGRPTSVQRSRLLVCKP